MRTNGCNDVMANPFPLRIPLEHYERVLKEAAEIVRGLA